MSQMTSSILRALGLAVVAGVLLAPAVRAEEPDAAKIFKTQCAFCHGKQGTPLPALAKQGVRDFADPEWQKSTSDEELQTVIKEGTKGTLMRGFEKQLSAEEIDALVAYVRQIGKTKKD